MLASLSLRLRIFLIFAGLGLGAVAVAGLGLWFGYASLGQPEVPTTFLQIGLGVAAAMLGLVAMRTHWFTRLPLAVLAANIMIAAINMIDLKALRQAWSYDRADAAALGEQFPQLRGLAVRRISSAGTVVAPVRVGDSFVA